MSFSYYNNLLINLNADISNIKILCMHNQFFFDQEMGNQLKHNYLPVVVQLVGLKIKVQTEGMKFEQSPYNIEEDKFVVRPVMDKQIRDSQFNYVEMPQLSNASAGLINKYFQSLNDFQGQYRQVNKVWRLTRYHVEGHFLEHHDRQKLLDEHKHFGTQIFLPPLSESKFEGGQLKIIQNDKVIEIIPNDTLWTHIIIPLGVKHQVKKITGGTRISYVKQIWLREYSQLIETDQDRQIRERREYQRNRDRTIRLD